MSNWKRYNMLLRYNYLLYSSKSVYSTNAGIPKVRLYRAIILSSPLIGCWPTEWANERATQKKYYICRSGLYGLRFLYFLNFVVKMQVHKNKYAPFERIQIHCVFRKTEMQWHFLSAGCQRKLAEATYDPK